MPEGVDLRPFCSPPHPGQMVGGALVGDKGARGDELSVSGEKVVQEERLPLQGLLDVRFE